MRITTKVVGLNDIIKKMQNSHRYLNLLSLALAEDTVELTKANFEKQANPYGNRWEKTKRGGRILEDTGALKNSIKVESYNAKRFRVEASVFYASTHQKGMTIKARRAPYLVFTINGVTYRKKQVTIPQRDFFPSRRLPSHYISEYRDTAETVASWFFG